MDEMSSWTEEGGLLDQSSLIGDAVSPSMQIELASLWLCSPDAKTLTISSGNAVYANPKVGFEATVAAVFIGIVPIALEVRKDLTPDDKRKEDAAFRPFPFL